MNDKLQAIVDEWTDVIVSDSSYIDREGLVQAGVNPDQVRAAIMEAIREAEQQGYLRGLSAAAAIVQEDMKSSAIAWGIDGQPVAWDAMDLTLRSIRALIDAKETSDA